MSKEKEVNIELRDWDHQCADGCCMNYGTEIIVNGVKSDNSYDGTDVAQALHFTLSQLGFNVKITNTHE